MAPQATLVLQNFSYLICIRYAYPVLFSVWYRETRMAGLTDGKKSSALSNVSKALLTM